MQTQIKILVVDDEPPIRKLLRTGLSSYGYSVSLASTGQEALNMTARDQLDFALLDINLASKPNGIELCSRLREWSAMPIIMLTVNDDKWTKLAALNAGADDYVTKPFDMEELEARIRAVLRRTAFKKSSTEQGEIYVHDLMINVVKRRVTLHGNEIHLTPTEYKLLCALATQPGKVLTFNALLREIKSDAEIATKQHYLHVYINTLRKKLQDDSSNTTHPLYIFNEPGVGYRFADLQPVE